MHIKRTIFLLFPAVVLVGSLAQGQQTSQGQTSQGQTSQAQSKLNTLRARAEAGNKNAQLALARTYYLGIGVPQDPAEALKWFRKAGEQGEPQSERILGMLYESGSAGLTKDDKQAAYWFGRAAEHGNVPAQVRMGQLYDSGAGAVPQDMSQAISWYRKAAAHDDGTSQNRLGQIYEQGLGVPKNEVDALYWYSKAGDHGLADALYHAARICLYSSNPEVRNPSGGLLYARQAVNVSPNNPEYLATLARGYALEGQYTEAVSAQLEALERVSPDKKKDYEQDLADYQHGLERNQKTATPSVWRVPKVYNPAPAPAPAPAAEQH